MARKKAEEPRRKREALGLKNTEFFTIELGI